MKIHKGDKVKVLSGKDKGKEGTVQRVYKNKGTVLVEGINMVKKHIKPGVISREGGIVSLEKPINASNVMPICEKCNRPVKVGYSVAHGKKHRVCKKCGEVFDK